MEGNLIEGNSLGVVYSKASGNVYQTTGGKPHTSLKVPDYKSGAADGLVPWGVDNLFPQRVLREIRKNTIIGPTLKKQAEFAYDEIVYGHEEEVNGEMKFVRKKDPRVEAFLRRSKINRYSLEALRSFYYWYFAVPELVLTADRSEIYSIRLQKTAHFRFAKQDVQGRIPHGYLCADWESCSSIADPSVVKVPLIDIYADPRQLKEGKDFKYIYPLAYPTEDEMFYPLVDWNTARESGWLEVAQSIPKFKKALFKNQISMKYLIQVPSWWWEWKYPGFENMEGKKRRKLMDYEVDRFEKFAKGEENAGNSMLVTFVSDPRYQKEYQGWNVQAIDNKMKDGMHIDDNNEASSHLLYALGMDPTINGQMPGTKLGAGSGSDKRVAFNIYIDTVKAHQDLILEPLSWVDEYNGWEGYTYKLKNSLEPATNPVRPEQASKNPMNEPNQQAN
jgi:hypothetical protein